VWPWYKEPATGREISRPLREGRSYNLQHLAGSNDKDFFHDLVEKHGLTAIEHMRVRETTGVNAWLTVVRRGGDLAKDAGLVLNTIAPVLRGVLQLFVAMERERFTASLSAEAVRRLQFGWITLDEAGQILQNDEQAAEVLRDGSVLAKGQTGKLLAKPRDVEREIYNALSGIVQNPGSRPRAITLYRDPWLDLLLVPVRSKSISPGHRPVAIAYVHGDNWHSADRCQQLAELFHLAPREAKLALALSRGLSIAEAAVEFGLTEGSARVYSRAIYAKTGARGLPDLVRIVLRSVLAFSPDS
jgi:DNA-binding CsgD family transcriptional regulator